MKAKFLIPFFFMYFIFISYCKSEVKKKDEFWIVPEFYVIHQFDDSTHSFHINPKLRLSFDRETRNGLDSAYIIISNDLILNHQINYLHVFIQNKSFVLKSNSSRFSFDVKLLKTFDEVSTFYFRISNSDKPTHKYPYFIIKQPFHWPKPFIKP